MKIDELFGHTFKAIRSQLGLHRSTVPMVQPTADSLFCRDLVDSDKLTAEQVAHAANCYRLGRSRSGKTIFWMIDQDGIVRDGRIGHSWASVMLRQRAPRLLQDFYPRHCLFGLHLLCSAPSKPICIVEAEEAAVLLSELFPDQLWMAWSYPANLIEWQLRPLAGHRVILYPRTDPAGDFYLASLEIAFQARRRFALDVSVCSILEDHATEAQKEEEIDIVDFLFDKPTGSLY
jgi:hypothetical protein